MADQVLTQAQLLEQLNPNGNTYQLDRRQFWRDLVVSYGPTSGTAAIVAGTIDGATIGSVTPAPGAFTTLLVTGSISGSGGNNNFAGNVGVSGAAGLGVFTVGGGSSNKVVISAGSPGSPTLIQGTGDAGLNLHAPGTQPVTVHKNNVAWAGPTQTGFQMQAVSVTGTSTDPLQTSAFKLLFSESLDRSIATSEPLEAFHIEHDYGGGTTKGGRLAFDVLLLQSGGANTDSGTDNFYTGGRFGALARQTQPGSSSANPLGRVFALNAISQVQQGFVARNLYQIAAAEFNVSLSAGSSARIRSVLTLADLVGTAQGFGSDNMLWLYGGGTAWRFGINFGDSQNWSIDSSVGTMFGANYGAGFQIGTMAAKWGADLQQVAFPATGNAYDGGPFRSKNWAVDGNGTMQIGSAYLTPGSSGLAIDAKGSIGVSAVIAVAGSGYEAGQVVFQALGGLWTINTVAGVPTGAVTPLVQPTAPSTTPPANPVTPTNLNRISTGSGLTLNITWNTTATTLALQPSGGPTTMGGPATATSYRVGANQLVGARDTGWGAMTGTPDKATAFATSTVTLAQLAGRMMSLQAALTTHGLIGP